MSVYSEINKGGKYIRTFNKNVVSEELVWHRDREDRVVKVLSENDWMFQFDNELPIKLMVNESITIPKNTYHRVIKGTTDLVVEITKLSDEVCVEEGGSKNPCWDGYEMIGMKGKDGEEVPNCVPVSERLIFDKKNRNFVKNYKDMIKSKLSENFSETKPIIKPGIKTNEPKVSPRRKRIWEAKPLVTPPGKM